MGDCSHADIMQLHGLKFQMLCFQIANYTSTDIHKFSVPHSNATPCAISTDITCTEWHDIPELSSTVLTVHPTLSVFPSPRI